MMNRLMAIIVYRRRVRGVVEPEGSSSHDSDGKKIGVLRSWIKRYITLPATFGYSHQQPMGYCTLPTRLQSIIVFIWVALNVIFCSVDYTAFDGNL